MNSAGRSRRARRIQKCFMSTVDVRSFSEISSSVIRYPEITKKTSTPRYPPGNQSELA